MRHIAIIGEVMIELAPTGDRLLRAGVSGDTYNTACALAGLGERVSYLTALGAGKSADTVRAHATTRGLSLLEDHSYAHRQPGLYLINVDARGERSFEYWRGESAARALFSDVAKFGELCAQAMAAEYLYVSGITLALMRHDVRESFDMFLRRYRSAGGRVVFDPNYRPALWASPDVAAEAVSALLPLVDIYLPGRAEEQQLFNSRSLAEVSAAMAPDGLREIIVKDGSARCKISIGGDIEHVAITAIDPVIDSSGAGDAFNGGYLAARLAGLNPQNAVRYGAVVAAEILGHRGAVLPVDRLQRLNRRLYDLRHAGRVRDDVNALREVLF